MFKILKRMFRSTSSKNMYPFKPCTESSKIKGFPSINVKPDCMECLVCQRRCPAGTIKFQNEKKRTVVVYNMAKCMVCQVCIDVCPKQRIASIENVELAQFDKEAFIWRLNH